MVGCPSVYDLRAEYRFPPFAAAKVSFCGYIAREPGRVGRAQARGQLGVHEGQPLVLVTPGGGEDGYTLISTVLQSLSTLAPAALPRTHIVCGPEMAEARRATIHEAASALPGVTVQDFSDDMMSLMGAADVVLAMGGYNTVCELLTLRRRAVLVPRVQPGVEQCIRAERMAAQGLVRMVHPDQLTPQALLEALQDELRAVAAHRLPPQLRRLDGLARVTESLFELMGLTPCSGLAQPPAPGAPTLPAKPADKALRATDRAAAAARTELHA